MTAEPRAQALEAKRQTLDIRLHELRSRPHWDHLEETKLCREKLVLKDLIEGIVEDK